MLGHGQRGGALTTGRGHRHGRREAGGERRLVLGVAAGGARPDEHLGRLGEPAEDSSSAGAATSIVDLEIMPMARSYTPREAEPEVAADRLEVVREVPIGGARVVAHARERPARPRPRDRPRPELECRVQRARVRRGPLGEPALRDDDTRGPQDATRPRPGSLVPPRWRTRRRCGGRVLREPRVPR